tara:strand:+ start:200 stop:691 length:492 start_codon:yes stop_codon:yes gene_type:complete
MSELNKWETPDSYAGHNPVGDYMIYSRTRDSSIMENSNYELILKELSDLAETFDNLRDDGEPYVYDFRAGHWACGWVEEIIIRKDAPKEIIERAKEIDAALSDWPIYSDDDYYERQLNEMRRYWNDIDIEERVEWLQESGESIFLARNDDHIPESLDESEMFY